MIRKQNIKVNNIPTTIWGDNAEQVYIYVHGKMGSKDDAKSFAEIASTKSIQVLSFDLPKHGERINENYECSAANAVSDLKTIADYVMRRWQKIMLFGCSLGAYFGLVAYKDLPIKKALFLSPVVDMELLIEYMLNEAGADKRILQKKQEIITPSGESVSWDYYSYVVKNRIVNWDIPTSILYGGKDNITKRDTVIDFANRFGCDLTVLGDCEHWFHTGPQLNELSKWLKMKV